MLDYQFLGMVAMVLAVVTRGALLPVVAVTAFIGLASLAFESTARWYRCHHHQEAAETGAAPPSPSDGDLTRWMAVVERALRAGD
jgi:hypothetical protein